MADSVTKPLLILAFNRPAHVKRLIDSLRPYRPQKILVGIDGPREKNKSDKEKIAQVLDEVNKIDWTSDVELRVRENNLGLRFAVADAVTWVIDKYGEVIVVEDDVEVGPEFLQFMSLMLDKFRDDDEVFHVSGYNLVPKSEVCFPGEAIRKSSIPESYAWATWSRAWEAYDPYLNWAKKLSISELKSLLGKVVPAIIWKVNFRDAERELISTWAYRWIGSIWSRGGVCISPNRNLVNYTGQSLGTHTRFPTSQVELPIESVLSLEVPLMTRLDSEADFWIQRNIFRASMPGVFIRIAQSVGLMLIKAVRGKLQ